MMLSLTLFAAVASLVSSHGIGWMGSNMIPGMGTNSMAMGINNMGLNMGIGIGNMGIGQQNMGLAQLLNMLSGRNQMGGGPMTGQMSGQNQQGVMGQIMFMLIQNLLQNRQGQQQQGGNRMNEEETEMMEELMKKKMMMEMAEMMMSHMEVKEKEEQFTMAMESLCFMVNATYEGYKRMGQNPFNQTTDASMEQLGADVMKMTEAEKMDFAVNMMRTNEARYREIFLRFATWACMTGEAYADAYMKMERINKGDASCPGGRD